MDDLICQDTQRGINISVENRKDIQLFFKTKNELKDTEYFQTVLSKYKSEDDDNFQKVRCLCDMNKKLYLSVKHFKKSNYFLSVFPKTAHLHNPKCLYYSPLFVENNEELCGEDGVYSKKIFEDIAKKKDSDDNKVIEFKNASRDMTFNNFCRDVLDRTSSFAFNVMNKDIHKRDELSMVDIDTFFDTFNKVIDGRTILDNTMNGSLNNGYSFVYGAIEDDIFSGADASKDWYFKFNAQRCEKIFIEDVNNKGKKIFGGYELKERGFTAGKNVISNARRLVTNFSNVIAPPYFFMGITKRESYVSKIDKKEKYSYKLIRLFVYPVVIFDKKICFVESGYERKYAIKLLKEGRVFVKPISNDCFYKLRNELTNCESKNIKKKVHLHYRPDFILLEKDGIVIVEVSGYEDKNYKELLAKKIEYYEEIKRLSREFYTHIEVEGRTIS